MNETIDAPTPNDPPPKALQAWRRAQRFALNTAGYQVELGVAGKEYAEAAQAIRDCQDDPALYKTLLGRAQLLAVAHLKVAKNLQDYAEHMLPMVEWMNRQPPADDQVEMSQG